MTWWHWALLGFGIWVLLMVPILAFMQCISDPYDEEWRNKW